MPDLHTRFGELLEHMFKVLQARKGRSMAETMAAVAQDLGVTPDALYKWRKGRSLPGLNALKRLADIGVNDAELDESWAAELLSLGRHPERGALLARLFSVSHSQVRHNLPNRTFLRLVGREPDIAEIRRRLAQESRHWLVAIEGIGGIGKTALALEVAWRYVEEYPELPAGRRFDALVWISASTQEPTLNMTLAPRDPMIRTLDDMLYKIGEVLDDSTILRSSPESRRNAVLTALRKSSRVLIVVDNLESVTDPKVLEFLRELPSPHKAILTTRFHEDVPYPLRLKGLDETAMAAYIEQECEARDVVLDEVQRKRICEGTLGIPLAAWWTIGLMAFDAATADEALNRLQAQGGSSIRFLFGEQIETLRKNYPLAFKILLDLSLFSPESGAIPDALVTTSGSPIERCRQGLQTLLRFNIVTRRDEERYTLLPLVRGYLTAEPHDYPDWDELAARERSLDWYHRWVATNGGEDLADWPAKYDLLDAEWPTLREVFSWCAQHNRTADLEHFWLGRGVGVFAEVRMKWSDRLLWYRYLARSPNPATAVEAHAEVGRTLALMDEFDRADKDLEQAWTLRNHVKPAVRCDVAAYRALRYLRQDDTSRATEWLDVLQRLIADLPTGPTEPDLLVRKRHEARLTYYRAVCTYQSGEIEAAATLFQDAADLCHAIKWERIALYVRTYQAELAMKCATGSSDELSAVHRMLTEILDAARRTKDRRHIARIKLLLAKCDRDRGERARARPWASQAKQEYDAMRHEQARIDDPGIGVPVADIITLTSTHQSAEERDAYELFAELCA